MTSNCRVKHSDARLDALAHASFRLPQRDRPDGRCQLANAAVKGQVAEPHPKHVAGAQQQVEGWVTDRPRVKLPSPFKTASASAGATSERATAGLPTAVRPLPPERRTLARLPSIGEFEAELSPGLWAGQKLIPVSASGCYVPGGRYAHVASSIMSIATAKVAGVENVIACSAPHPAHGGINPALLVGNISK